MLGSHSRPIKSEYLWMGSPLSPLSPLPLSLGISLGWELYNGSSHSGAGETRDAAPLFKKGI